MNQSVSPWRHVALLGAACGALWALSVNFIGAMLWAFLSGVSGPLSLSQSALVGVLLGVAMSCLGTVPLAWRRSLAVLAVAVSTLWYTTQGFLAHSSSVWLVAAGFAVLLCGPLFRIFSAAPRWYLSRHEFEDLLLRFALLWGAVVFAVLVAVPFYVMLVTSLKSQQALMMNPLDYRIDFSQAGALFRSYEELFRDFNFGRYMLTSFVVSLLTVIITLLLSIPGAYAVARLRFRGRAALSRGILLVYMVPMIVLALPIYIAFSMLELRNTLLGIVLIYPVTTIPVALYMLQGYFRGLPTEVEEAGLMDGLSRITVLIKITLPLALPALASVSLYVFMIAWNEFLLAFMLLDDPQIFTLTRGVAMLNSSEIPRQHLMAGAVIATVPIMAIFLGLERFMTKGLTAGSVKG